MSEGASFWTGTEDIYKPGSKRKQKQVIQFQEKRQERVIKVAQELYKKLKTERI